MALACPSDAAHLQVMEGTRIPRRAGLSRRSVLSRVREAGTVQWRALQRIGRISFVGVVASAALAVFLGVMIPRAARDQILGAELDSVVALVGVLEAQETLPPMGENLSEADYDRFDSLVRGGLLSGENLRVKLWNLEGEIIYSDNRTLPGRVFTPTENLQAAMVGSPSAEVSDLSAEENDFDRDLGPRLLEFYVPVDDASGNIVGVFEIYQDYGPLESRLATIQRIVWASVVGGLSILFVFLWFLFMGTASAITREKHVAEERAEALKEVTDSRGRLLRRMVWIQEEERRHLVGDLHDGLGQALTRILFGLRGCRVRLGEPQVAAELAHLEEIVDGQTRDLRRYMAHIKPALLSDKGLAAALEAFAQDQELEAGLPIEVRVDGVPQLDDAVAVTLFRAAQETVINARKHAEASRISILLTGQDRWVELLVADDGCGSSDLQKGVGLSYMRDRVASLGGTVDITSRTGSGTTVRVRVPEGSDHG